jgi:anti-sigma factor RsiW
MTPEKFFDYLEGKLPPPERERLERALISDPELQKQFVTARQIHRGMDRPAGESAATTRAGSRGRQLAAAFAVLVALNVGIGLYFIFRSTQLPPEVRQAREEALRQRLQSALEKFAAATFTPPIIGPETITLTIPSEKQNSVAKAIVDAAGKAGGSGTKDLPNDGNLRVFVLVPASAEAKFRRLLTELGAPPPSPSTPSPPASPNEPVHLEIVLSSPR